MEVRLGNCTGSRRTRSRTPPEHSDARPESLDLDAHGRRCHDAEPPAVLPFRDADCGAVPVLDGGKPVGVLTDRDVALALADYYEGRLPGLPVGEIMSKAPITIAPDASLDAVLEQFGDRGVRRLLVVGADNRLRGIVGWADVAPHAPDVGTFSLPVPLTAGARTSGRRGH